MAPTGPTKSERNPTQRSNGASGWTPSAAKRGAERWERLWRWLDLTAGVKTALECASIVTQNEPGLDRAFTWMTVAVVAAFVIAAAGWSRRGDLREHPPLAGAPRAWLMASLGIWAVFAIAPRFVA